jgi:phosphate transport system permease protein
MNPKLTQRLVFALLGISALVVMSPVLFILGVLIIKGASGINWQFLTSMPENAMTEGGIFPAIVGTFWLVMGTIIISLPLGVSAAIYLTEYAPTGKMTRLIRLAIVNLAGVPSVVYGLFGLGVFVLMMNFGTSVLADPLLLRSWYFQS